MADDLSLMWNKLTLKDDENQVIDIDGSQDSQKFCLIGKILTKKVLKVDILRSVFFRVWKLSGGLRVQEVGDKMFLFQFDRMGERDRVLLQQPWSFNKALMVLQEFDGSVLPEDVDLDWCSFWVQIHGLPMAYMTEKTAMSIGKVAGIVEEIGMDDGKVGWGKILRVRTSLNVHRRLKRGTKINLPESGQKVVTFKYERLPNFCYFCGCLSHHESECEEAYIMKRATGKIIREYGPWLRAEWPLSGSSFQECPSGSMSVTVSELLRNGESGRRCNHDNESTAESTGRINGRVIPVTAAENKTIMGINAHHDDPLPAVTTRQEILGHVAAISESLARGSLNAGDVALVAASMGQNVGPINNVSALTQSTSSVPIRTGITGSTFVFGSNEVRAASSSKVISNWKRRARVANSKNGSGSFVSGRQVGQKRIPVEASTIDVNIDAGGKRPKEGGAYVGRVFSTDRMAEKGSISPLRQEI
ncbi:hypothetical protein CCACVL1_30745 [Corchorus capsularis]|uniref:DUF4283 domain-containing protein n=1 Tax=Corchorus capsularis TaxID=210143 RepID=A0A1R3FW06_COCAP|nr:hypothetical protein CCACVL1_30745 [Corchorus capsularis]